MSFTTGYLADIQKVGAGEKQGQAHTILTFDTFESGLKQGRFCKLDTGSIDNLDGSATPVIPGVVLRNPASPVESGYAISTDYYNQVEVVHCGLVTIDVASGETPAAFGRVYAKNTTGEATATSSDIETNATFIEEIKSGVWLIMMQPGNLTPVEAWEPSAYTASTLPTASEYTGKVIYVSDGVNGSLPGLARSTGSAWVMLENAASFQPDVYTVATVPDATAYTYKIIAVSDGNAGSATLAWSDGTNWKVLTTGDTIAAA